MPIELIHKATWSLLSFCVDQTELNFLFGLSSLIEELSLSNFKADTC
jgi:hypothetical protein